jgi:hypothetical protein
MGGGHSPEEPGPGPLPPRISAYLYPWDVLGDPELVVRLGSAGIGHVVVAAAYHSVLAATPQHPLHRFVVAETAALYRPVRPEIWAGRRLRPYGAPWSGCEDSFERAVEQLTAGGLGVSAWVVLTHNSALGRRHRDLTVRNCFGDSYEWALCPANEEVRNYAGLLAAEAVRELPLEGVSLEACGQLGAVHASHHDKTANAYSPIANKILSVCCCEACGRAWSLKGLERPDVTGALRQAFRTAMEDSSAATSPEDLLGEPLATELLATRQRHRDGLTEQVLNELTDSASLRTTLHAQANPWATGASPGLTTTTPAQLDCVLTPLEPTSPRCADTIGALRALLPEGVAAAGYVNLLGAEPAGFEAHADRLANAGADELHLYHFGVANKAQLELFSRLASLST